MPRHKNFSGKPTTTPCYVIYHIIYNYLMLRHDNYVMICHENLSRNYFEYNFKICYNSNMAKKRTRQNDVKQVRKVLEGLSKNTEPKQTLACKGFACVFNINFT